METRLLSTDEAAERWGLSPRSLEKWRLVGGGPPYRKLGRLVRYHPSDLDSWLELQRRRSTSETDPDVAL